MDSLDPELLQTLNNIRNSLVERWTFRMLNDLPRNYAFHSAITKAISEHKEKFCTVLDIGSGTGLLSLYAATSGVGKVVAVEQDDVMFGISQKVLSGLDNVEVIHCASQDLDLENRNVDIVITETLDSIGIGEGIISSCHDIATRSKNSEITFIPSAISLCGVLIRSETLHKSGFHEEFRSSVGTKSEPYCCEYIEEFPDTVPLSEPKSVFHVTMGDPLPSKVMVIEIEAHASGYCDGICTYFTAQLSRNNGICSAPSFVKMGANQTRVKCWEQGWHPLPQRYLQVGFRARIKVELSSDSVVFSWIGDSDEYQVLEPDQIKYLNSDFVSKGGQLLNVVPKIFDVGGTLLSDPFKCESVECISFYGYVIHSKRLTSWTRTLPQSLYIQDPARAHLLTSQINKYQTLVHEHVPWESLEHEKLSEPLGLLKISRAQRDLCRSQVRFKSKLSLRPTGLVWWSELVFKSGERFHTGEERLWRPAAVVFQGDVVVGEEYLLSVCFEGSCLFASLKSSPVR